MKVSKPVLIALVVAILFAGYTFLFTGQKRPVSGPLTIENPAGATPGKPPPLSTPQNHRPNIADMNLAWRDDPFSLPKSITDKKTEKSKAVLKLTAIMESRQGRYAIVAGEIVKKGDMIGDEKVADIGNNTVILVRDRGKRTLSMEDAGQ